ncbi:MAG: hypothetical protein KBT36_06670 [Kurthia sp.]|nr:hypothetical protein [Candidatus Kurthia equi]
MASAWIPTTVMGLAILVLAIYILRTKNLTILVGMQIMQIKTNHIEVAKNSGKFLLAIAVLTLLLPVMEIIHLSTLVVDLVLIFFMAISLFVYIYKQKK